MAQPIGVNERNLVKSVRSLNGPGRNGDVSSAGFGAMSSR
jgi:hypothetical protein